MNTLTHIIDHGVTLYMPIIKHSDGTYYSPETVGGGYTLEDLVFDIITGNLEDIAAVMCIWGEAAGTDATETIRGEAFDAIDWTGEAEDIERNTVSFVKAHKDFDARKMQHVKDCEEERRHEAAERQGL